MHQWLCQCHPAKAGGEELGRVSLRLHESDVAGLEPWLQARKRYPIQLRLPNFGKTCVETYGLCQCHPTPSTDSI